MAGKVEVVDYNPDWAKAFKEESKKIKEALGKNCVIVQHIGSTALKGMKARPIIDIMPIVKDLSQSIECREKLEALGYECKEEHLYVKSEGNTAYCIFILADRNKSESGRHLAIREYLRAHEDTAKEYAELKTKLAAEFPYDQNGYCDGKNEFLKALEEKAVAWSENEMQRSNYISLGMCMGLCMGTALGSSMGNLAMGMSLGLCMGTALGVAIGQQKIKK